MDALYVLKHSSFADIEIRYSLRSLEKYAPFIRKVWVFGDRPAFLSDDRARIEHVPHEYTARLFPFTPPLTNTFLTIFLASLIPELDSEFLWFCDDFILLGDLSEEDARTDRYLEDLDQVKNRGTGLWKQALWRTYDLLKRKGYPCLNFETHTPTFLTKKRVFDAYCDLRDFVTEDRFFGLTGPTAILNHALRNESMPLTKLGDEKSLARFHHQQPDERTVRERCSGKKFLNFDDDAFGPALRGYLEERFPEPCSFENPAVNGQPIDGRSPGTPSARAVLNPEPLVGGAFIPPPSPED